MQVITMQTHPSDTLTAEEAFKARLARLPELSRAIRMAKHSLSAHQHRAVFRLLTVDKIDQDPSTGVIKKHWALDISYWKSGQQTAVLLGFDDTIKQSVSSAILRQRWAKPLDLGTISLSQLDEIIEHLNTVATMPR